jgi:hypothetical protein
MSATLASACNFASYRATKRSTIFTDKASATSGFAPHIQLAAVQNPEQFFLPFR